MCSMSKYNLVMYVLINNSLGMSKGKIAAQASHVVSSVTERMVKTRPDIWKVYSKNFHPKIILRADKDTMDWAIKEYSNYDSSIWCEYVLDAGFTEVPENSLTAIAFCPIDKKNVPTWLNKLKLL